MSGRLDILRDYFPTAVFNGSELIFISENSMVKLTEHFRGGLSEAEKVSVIRVRLYTKTEHSEFEPSHYEDFHLENIADLAGEIEKYIQHAIGKNLKE